MTAKYCNAFNTMHTSDPLHLNDLKTLFYLNPSEDGCQYNFDHRGQCKTEY